MSLFRSLICHEVTTFKQSKASFDSSNYTSHSDRFDVAFIHFPFLSKSRFLRLPRIESIRKAFKKAIILSVGSCHVFHTK